MFLTIQYFKLQKFVGVLLEADNVTMDLYANSLI